MSAKHIFRLDDISENMHWKNYERIKEIFISHDVKPLIGVIPNNEDPELLRYPKCNKDFWSEIRKRKNDNGWSIALHGYNHVYESKNSGMLKVHNRSEFAGLPKHKQFKKIQEGLKIFKEKGIEADAFMAPSHSFDEITIECLKENGIDVITDGYSLYPYSKYGVLFVPQLFSKPRKFPVGIYTWCLHLNHMSEREIRELERFIERNRRNIISFLEAQDYVVGSLSYMLQNFLLGSSVKALRCWRRTVRKSL